MGNQRRYASSLLLAIPLILSCHLVLGQDGGKAEPESRQRPTGQRFSSSSKKPSRDYKGVDPSFTANLEGSMTGGQAQLDIETQLATDSHGRLESLLRGARTEECRQEILEDYQNYMGAMALERTLPFEGMRFTSQCEDSTRRPEVPPEGLYDPEEVRLVYVLLAHEEPDQVIRLVNSLDDTPEMDRTWFVLHIDAKAEDVHLELLEAFKDRNNVIMMEKGRLDVAWGGFNVVQATLNAMDLVFEREIPFHWLWILSGTTYPIASNDAIRAKMASHHPESIFMESKTATHTPATTTWHYFVECDSALHRIGRNLLPRGIDMYVGSQWLAMPPAAARWLMEDERLVPKYAEYARHIVVADENFFPTLFKNSPFCGNQVASNLVHVQFDRYEHTLDREERRMDKCLMPNPDHCGRSPATMTLDYLSVLEHSDMLFARKFDPKDTEVFEVLDRIRNGEQAWRAGPTFNFVSIRSKAALRAGGAEPEAEGEGVLCLSLDHAQDSRRRKGGSTNEAKMKKCVDVDPRQVFKLGPCSSNGHLELGEGGQGFMKSTRGAASGRAPSCSVTSARGTCLDLLGEAKGPGASVISYKCHNRWNQFFSFGEGELAGHLVVTVPSHLAMADEFSGGTLCLEAVETENGVAVETARCFADSAAQKFEVVQLPPLERPAPRTPPTTNGGGGGPEEECAGPEGTCPAKQ